MSSKTLSFGKWLNAARSEIPSAGSAAGVSPKLIELARKEVNKMLKLPGNNEPNRGDLEISSIEWRKGKPDYTLANLAYLKGKSRSHEKGSLEMIVENAVKTVARIKFFIVCLY